MRIVRGVPGIFDVRPEDHDRALGILRLLRPALDKSTFEQQLATQMDYRLIGSYTPALSGVIGLRLVEASNGKRHLNLEEVVVAETYRGQGLGRALLSFAGGEARRMHCTAILLESPEAMRPFFEKHGFVPHEGTLLRRPLE
ncbi:MAG TPA: GNAT family N-acetyltransferase [Gammaproteobacteria bacterium]|nr:GNAT family N-acetyltransferase [Gammaproteobacteria bacterium]